MIIHPKEFFDLKVHEHTNLLINVKNKSKK